MITYSYSKVFLNTTTHGIKYIYKPIRLPLHQRTIDYSSIMLLVFTHQCLSTLFDMEYFVASIKEVYFLRLNYSLNTIPLSVY